MMPMQTWFFLSDVPAQAGSSIVAVGKFDGVHIGHLEILRRLTEIADARGAASVVVTFDRHPESLFAPESAPDDISGMPHRLKLIEDAGVQSTLVLPFTRELASLSPHDFVEQVLVTALNASVVLVGHDFRFGAKAVGDVTALRQLGQTFGFDVIVIEDVQDAHGNRASSSAIRELMAVGNVSASADLLGRLPSVQGIVVHGAARGRELGFPTANLSQEATGLVPADGVYAGWLTADGVRYPAAISVGTNPTFHGQLHRTVEAYVIDEDLDLYDKNAVVEFAQRLRGMESFASIDALIVQMDQDVAQARDLLGACA
jgi:riboflavin kinase/FMN adenylyltransferase